MLYEGPRIWGCQIRDDLGCPLTTNAAGLYASMKSSYSACFLLLVGFQRLGFQKPARTMFWVTSFGVQEVAQKARQRTDRGAPRKDITHCGWLVSAACQHADEQLKPSTRDQTVYAPKYLPHANQWVPFFQGVFGRSPYFNKLQSLGIQVPSQKVLGPSKTYITVSPITF